MGKPKPNAFYYYMQERKKQFENQGKKYTMQQMPQLVGNDWKVLGFSGYHIRITFASFRVIPSIYFL